MKRIRRRRHEPVFQQKNPFIQPKLKVGKAGDKFEVEADNMAKKVVGNSGNTSSGLIQKAGLPEEEKVQKNSLPESTAKIQKQEFKEEEPVQKQENEEQEVQSKIDEEEQVQKAEITQEEEPVQAQTEEQPEEVQAKTAEEEEPLQAKTNPDTPPRSSLAANIEAPLSQSKGSGRAMDKNIRHEMESGFGADFSKVRIHTDGRAQKMSKEIGAQAFTNGNDIYFNSGKYNPESSAGKLLLAHELTHTIQQKGMVQKKVQGHWSKSETYHAYDGKVINADLNLNFFGAVLNKSSNAGLNTAGLASAAQSQIENSYKGKIKKSVLGIDVIYNVTTKANVRVIPQLADLKFSKEHLIVVLDDAHPKVKGTYGRGPFYGSIVYLNEKHTPNMINGSDKNTIPHEVGHTAGLKHLLERSEESGFLGKLIKDLHHTHNKDNIMWRGGGHPTYSAADADSKLVKTSPEQLDKINKNLNSNKLNQVDLFSIIDLFVLAK